MCLSFMLCLPHACNPTDTNLMKSTSMYVGVGAVNTSVRNAVSAVRSPACCENIFAPTQMSGHTTVSTATSPSRQKVRAEWLVQCLKL